VVLRLSLALIAALALAWLGVLLRDHELGQAAFDRLSHDRNLTPAESRRELHHLDDSQLLNPESTWELDRGSYWLAQGRERRAARIVEGLLRNEPRNIEALTILFLATQKTDPHRSAQALAELRRFNPLGVPASARSPRSRHPP
jgi:hypothetical protein